MWTQYGSPLSTDEAQNRSRYLRFKPAENNLVLLAMRTWVILYNPPSFTNLRAKLYSDRNGLPSGLIATSSNAWTKAEMLTTYNYGTKEIYFEFDPKITLHKNVYYHFVLNCDNYTYSDESHIAWRIGWPDPIYGTATSNNLLYSPYIFSLIGADL